MSNTKLYLYTLTFAPGNVDKPERRWDLPQGIRKARTVLGHRIELTASEDHDDLRDEGCAPRRLSFLKESLVAGLVDETRLELSENACTTEAGSFGRRAEIHLFPRVASLCAGGRPFLSREEVSALSTARQVVLSPLSEYTDFRRTLLARYEPYDWIRMIGHESLDQWASAGARHPLFDGDIQRNTGDP